MNNTDLQKYLFFSDGKLTAGRDANFFDAVNPSSGEVFAKIADAGIDDMKSAVRSARAAFDSGCWSDLTAQERGKYLFKIAELIRENAKVLAELETLSTGKTTKHSTFIDVPSCADTFEYFAGASDLLAGHHLPVSAPAAVRTEYEPFGVVGAIIPWNYPLIMAAWKIAPALLAGNTLVLKPSPWGSVSVLKLAEIIAAVKLPKGVLNVVASSKIEVGQELVRDSRMDMISFTGGTKTGREIMKLCAETPKKVTLELGGKSANIVFADCDREAAIGGTLSAIFINQGQMCTAGSRLLIDERIADDFIGELVSKVKSLRIGPADEYETDFGPLVSREHRDRVLVAIQSGIKEGASVLCGGQVPQQPHLQNGAYLEPTILGKLNNQMTVAREEIFGPVLVVMKFKDEDEAVLIANDSSYGLSASIWTKDLVKANRVAKGLQCGTVWVNTYGAFFNEVPFGGYKQSGFSRELGRAGLLEYTQSKHVCIDQTPGGKSLVTSWF